MTMRYPKKVWCHACLEMVRDPRPHHLGWSEERKAYLWCCDRLECHSGVNCPAWEEGRRLSGADGWNPQPLKLQNPPVVELDLVEFLRSKYGLNRDSETHETDFVAQNGCILRIKHPIYFACTSSPVPPFVFTTGDGTECQIHVWRQSRLPERQMWLV